MTITFKRKISWAQQFKWLSEGLESDVLTAGDDSQTEPWNNIQAFQLWASWMCLSPCKVLNSNNVLNGDSRKSDL